MPRARNKSGEANWRNTLPIRQAVGARRAKAEPSTITLMDDNNPEVLNSKKARRTYNATPRSIKRTRSGDSAAFLAPLGILSTFEGAATLGGNEPVVERLPLETAVDSRSSPQ